MRERGEVIFNFVLAVAKKKDYKDGKQNLHDKIFLQVVLRSRLPFGTPMIISFHGSVKLLMFR